MKLNISFLQVAIDTLNGSLRLNDRGEVFSYSPDSRRVAMEEIQRMMNTLTVDIFLTNDSTVREGE